MQLGHVVRQGRGGRKGRGSCPGDAEGQRQAGTPFHELAHRGLLGGHACAAEMSGHDLTRLIGGHHVEGEGAQTVGDRQPGQPPPTGDQDRAPGAAGQQGGHGAGVRGIVEDDQHPAIGEPGSIQGSLGVDLGRDVGLRHVQRVQEPPEGSSRRRRLADGVEPVEVDVQLTVRVARGVPAGPLPGQPRLAHATAGTDRDDRRLVRALSRHHAGELGELGGAAREGRGRRQ